MFSFALELLRIVPQNSVQCAVGRLMTRVLMWWHCCHHSSLVGQCRVEFQTKVCEDFTIMEKAPTRHLAPQPSPIPIHLFGVKSAVNQQSARVLVLAGLVWYGPMCVMRVRRQLQNESESTLRSRSHVGYKDSASAYLRFHIKDTMKTLC